MQGFWLEYRRICERPLSLLMKFDLPVLARSSVLPGPLNRGTGWKRVFWWVLVLAAYPIWVSASLSVASPAHVLFDVGSDHFDLPTSCGWDYFAISGQAVVEPLTSTDVSAVVLDTGSDLQEIAGWIRESPVPLDDRMGYTLVFTLRLLEETHVSDHRAGFSLTVLGNNLLGVELGFWEEVVWAQADQPLFTRAETTAWETTEWHTYELLVHDGYYRLTVGGNEILKGPLRDYSTFSGPLNPYRTPNLLFVGDNTRSASARVALKRMELLHQDVAPSTPALRWRRTAEEWILEWEPHADLELQYTLDFGYSMSWQPLPGASVESGSHRIRWDDILQGGHGIVDGSFKGLWLRLVTKSPHTDP